MVKEDSGDDLKKKIKDLEKTLDDCHLPMNIKRYLGKRLKNRDNHTMLQLATSRYLIEEGYDVSLEYVKTPSLQCDIWATRTSNGVNEDLNIEIESGPLYNSKHRKKYNASVVERGADYIMARDISKAARYSHASKRFGFGIPSTYILQIPREFLLAPEKGARKSLGNTNVFATIFILRKKR